MTKVTSPEPPAAPALFEIFPFTGNMTEDDLPHPKNGPYYVITKTKTFIHKFFHFGRVLTKVEGAGGLPHLATLSKENWNGFLWHDIKPLPAGLIGQAWSFFRQIYQDLGTEAMVYITYHKEHGYRFFIPPQWNTGGHVNSKFTPEHIKDGWANVGTIHSHCNFSAFHSGTDHNDAKQQDGLHITIGNVNTEKPSYAVMISVGGVNWDFKLDDITTETPECVPHPRWWERYVNKAEVKTTSSYQSTGYGYYGGSYSGWSEGKKWDSNLKRYVDDPDYKPKGVQTVPTLPATHNQAPKDTTVPKDAVEAMIKKFNDLDGGWDDKQRMFKIGNDRYTGTNLVRVLGLMHQYGVVPDDWDKQDLLSLASRLEHENDAVVTSIQELGVKVHTLYQYDPDLALNFASPAEMEDLEDERLDAYYARLWSDEDFSDDDEEALLPGSGTTRSIHAATDEQIKELYN